MQSVITIRLEDVIKVIIVDLCALMAVFVFPSITHLFRIPLYLMEPMRIILFSLIIIEPRFVKNQCVMAFMMPIASYMLSGHPVFAKSIIMSCELLVNVLALNWVLGKMSVFKSVLLSVIISKAIYYMLKWFLIGRGLLYMDLVSTDLFIQMIVVIMLAFVCKYLYRKKYAQNISY